MPSSPHCVAKLRGFGLVQIWDKKGTSNPPLHRWKWVWVWKRRATMLKMVRMRMTWCCSSIRLFERPGWDCTWYGDKHVFASAVLNTFVFQGSSIIDPFGDKGLLVYLNSRPWARQGRPYLLIIFQDHHFINFNLICSYLGFEGKCKTWRVW